MSLDSFEDLYRNHRPAVYSRARSILADDAAAEDAVQEVFAKAIRCRASFRAEASVRTWLYRMTTNYCLNVKRDTSRRRKLLDEKVAPALGVVSHGRLDATISVNGLMRRASTDVGAVARCFYMEGMTQEETAERLGVSRRTVGNRLKSFRELAQRA